MGPLAAGGPEHLKVLEDVGLFTLAEIHADEKSMARLTRRLCRLVDDLSKESDEHEGTDADARRFRLLLAYYPFPRFPDE